MAAIIGLTRPDTSRYLQVSYIFEAEKQWFRFIGDHDPWHTIEVVHEGEHLQAICHTCRKIGNLSVYEAHQDLIDQVGLGMGFVARVQREYREGISTLWDRLVSEDSLEG